MDCRHHHHSHAAPRAARITDAILHVFYPSPHHGAHQVSKATLAGNTPTTRVDNSALSLAEIDSIDFFDDIGDGNGPQKIGTLSGPAATFSFTTGVLSVGTHVFTGVVNDTKGHKSAPSNGASLDVPATLAAPSPIVGLTVTIVPDDAAPAPAPAPAPQPAGISGSG